MSILLMLVIILALLAVSYGGFLFWSWVFAQSKKSTGNSVNGLLAALVTSVFLSMSTGASYASTPTIAFDLTPFFDSLNLYLPIFIGLFGIVGGIAGAMALARYVIGAVVRAFSGQSI